MANPHESDALGSQHLLTAGGNSFDDMISFALDGLSRDSVVRIPGITIAQADDAIWKISQKLGLDEKLQIQAGFASRAGHRHNTSKYFMSVNKRSDYQFIPPHSEGDSFMNMQIAAFYCHQNTTDGGHSILMHVRGTAAEPWTKLREKVRRGKFFRTLTRAEIGMAKMLYQLDLPADQVGRNSEILREMETRIPGLSLVEALARPRRTRSVILNTELNAYWDSIASIDFDSGTQFLDFLTVRGLLKLPPEGMPATRLDNAFERRLRSSGLGYDLLFDHHIICKLAPGDLIVQNNVTWAHATSNWTPESGVRSVSAAFA